MNAEKYTTKVREALEAAQNVARHHGQQQIDVEHLLFALVKDSQGLVPNLFSKMGAGTGPLTARLEQAINDKIKENIVAQGSDEENKNKES